MLERSVEAIHNNPGVLIGEGVQYEILSPDEIIPLDGKHLYVSLLCGPSLNIQHVITMASTAEVKQTLRCPHHGRDAILAGFVPNNLRPINSVSSTLP